MKQTTPTPYIWISQSVYTRGKQNAVLKNLLKSSKKLDIILLDSPVFYIEYYETYSMCGRRSVGTW